MQKSYHQSALPIFQAPEHAIINLKEHLNPLNQQSKV